MTSLGPDIGDHNRFTVSTYWISQEVGQLGLSIWDMSTLFATQSKDDLLEETERLVDEAGLDKNLAFWASFFGHFTTS